jgi:hypothetical protein
MMTRDRSAALREAGPVLGRQFKSTMVFLKACYDASSAVMPSRVTQMAWVDAS